MTDPDETPLEQVERHIGEAERMIARQREIMVEMDQDNHPNAADHARRLLAVMEETLRVFRQQLEVIRGRN